MEVTEEVSGNGGVGALRGVTSAAALTAQKRPRLVSGCSLLDRALDGGLPYGAVSEWGLPLGGGGRRVLVEFLARATSDITRGDGKPALWCLWVRPAGSDLQIYPPSWSALGVNLARMRFAYCQHAVDELKPLLVDPFFTVVVLDAPERLSRDDLAYLAREARRQNRVIVVLRDAMLTIGRGNVWAKIRVNCQRVSFQAEEYLLQTVRGLPPRHVRFSLSSERPARRA